MHLDHLRSGATSSCGCLQKERAAEASGRLQVGYSGAHYRVKRIKGLATSHDCVDCGERAKDWSYNGLDPNEIRGGQNNCRFSSDPDYYVPRCRSCHRKHDRAATSGAVAS